MNKVKESSKNKEEKIIELEKQVATSVISVSRDFMLSLNIIDPKQLDELYATVPEISRAVDLRGATVISRGFEITARDESEEAKRYASACLKLMNDSGGVSFVEGIQKNADLYGNAYIEIVKDENDSDITRFAHIHPYQFGYELETFTVDGQKKTRVKLDQKTQLPVGFATYKFNELDQIFENDKTIELQDVAHVKYKTVGDAIYGISIVQPMFGSVLRKLKIEDSVEHAARMVAAPKIVITGEFADDEEARRDAREAANLDTQDVVILQNGKEFKIISPGDIELPKLREMFVNNITTATGIPRPILTSEGTDINKATLQELMISLRENMRSNMNKIKEVIESQMFLRIGESLGITNFEMLVPIFTFPEDKDSEDTKIVREERKAATLTSLSNSMQLLVNQLSQFSGSDTNTSLVDSDLLESYNTALRTTLDLYAKTAAGFDVNNDQSIGKIEEVPIEKELTLDSHETNIYNQYSIRDEIDTIKQQDVLLTKHHLVHSAFEHLRGGSIIVDPVTTNEISMVQLIEKHLQYVELMQEIGLEHPHSDVGSELDQISIMR